jgi:TatD DNase family protein
MRIIDSHSHIDTAEFDADREAVLERARSAGVELQLVPAINAAGWPKLRELARRHADIRPAYGLHPMYLGDHEPQHLDDLGDWLAQEKPCAVGECGLDFFVDGLDPVTQRRYFQRQLEIARDFALPVIVHARRAVDEVIATARRIGGRGGIVHSYPGSIEQAQQLHRLGFALGIGGPITYPRANRLRAVVAEAPLEQLVLETDSPDQPLHGHQGERNEPARLPEVLRIVAKLRGESEERIAEATSANVVRLFGLH